MNLIQPLVAGTVWTGLSITALVLMAQGLNMTGLAYWQQAAYLLMGAAISSLAVMDFTTRSYRNSKAGKK